MSPHKKTKKPQIDGFPSRYSMVDHRSSKSEIPSPTSITSPSRIKRGKRLTLTKAPAASGGSNIATVSGSHLSKPENRTAAVEPRSKHLVVSDSKTPFHGATSHSDAQFHDSYPDTERLPQAQEDLDKIFDGDTLPVRKREQARSKVKMRGETSKRERRSGDFEGMNRHESQSPSGLPQRSHPITRNPGRVSSHQHGVPTRYQNPSAGMKTHPPQDAPLSYGGHRDSQGAIRNQSISEHQAAKNSKQVQFKPGHHHDNRPHPLKSRSSGIPMRATKSAQTPAANDVPLTSYPRSHTQAMKQRSASNGRVQQQYQQHQLHSGHAYYAGGRPGGSTHYNVGGYGDSVNNETMGSLV